MEDDIKMVLVYKRVGWDWIHIQASLVIRDLTLRVFVLTRFGGKEKAVRKLYSNFAVTMYGGGVTVARAPAGHILPVSV